MGALFIIMDDIAKLINKDKQEALSYTTLIELLDYAPDSGIFTWKVKKGSARPGDIVGNKPTSNGYLRVSINKNSYYLHRLAWFYYYKKWPSMYIDHIDGNRLNNSISNLQDVSSIDNNRKQKNCLGESGERCINVDKSTNKYQVLIRKVYLGQYTSKEEAIQVRDNYLASNNLFIDNNNYVRDIL